MRNHDAIGVQRLRDDELHSRLHLSLGGVKVNLVQILDNATAVVPDQQHLLMRVGGYPTGKSGSRFKWAECRWLKAGANSLLAVNAASGTTVGPTSSIGRLAAPQPPDQATVSRGCQNPGGIAAGAGCRGRVS